PATATISALSLHAALPISDRDFSADVLRSARGRVRGSSRSDDVRREPVGILMTSADAPHTHWPSSTGHCRTAAQKDWSAGRCARSEEYTSELQSRENLVCR